ncbi:hypothetical protein NVIRPANT_00613 [Pantoea sp. Nvir]|nr:hypothetical protein NVIRPANT_00613 [Pantoea sp. Nvir]
MSLFFIFKYYTLEQLSRAYFAIFYLLFTIEILFHVQYTLSLYLLKGTLLW